MFRLGVALALLGCGRIGFGPAEGVTSDAGADDGPPDARVELVDQLACNGAATLTTVTNLVDQLYWLQDAAGDWLAVLHHVTDTDHPLRRYRLAIGASGVEATFEGMIVQTTDAVTEIVELPSRRALVINELSTGGGRVVPLGDGVVAGAETASLGIGYADRPAARAGDGGVALVGISGGLVAQRLAADGTVQAGSTSTITTAGEGPSWPAIAGLSSGFVVAWAATATNRCRVARLAADLSVVAGPIEITTPGPCRFPRAEPLDGDRIVVAAQDNAAGTLHVATYDLALVQTTPTQVLPQATVAHLLGDGARTWISWSGTSSTPDAHVGWIDRGGLVTEGPPLSRIRVMMPWAHALGRVAGKPVLLWSGAAGEIHATQLCR